MTPLPRLRVETHGIGFDYINLVRGLERLEYRGLPLGDIELALRLDRDWSALAIGMAGTCGADQWDAAAEVRGILAENNRDLPWWARD
jgi:hypothetical protein